MMILPFAESWFVVTFHGECPLSVLAHGWASVIACVDRETGNTGLSASLQDKWADGDNWKTLNRHYLGNDDERHQWGPEEVDECVWLHIVRLTEPITIAELSNELRTLLPTVNLEELERLAIRQALETHHGNRTHAARAMGISVRTIQRNMKRYGIEESSETRETRSSPLTPKN